MTKAAIDHEWKMLERLGMEGYLKRMEHNRYLIRATNLSHVTAKALVKKVKAAEYLLIQEKLRQAHQ